MILLKKNKNIKKRSGTLNKHESKYFNTAVRIDEAFLELLNKKEIEYITVKEICNKASINRSTFYLHYENIYHLLEQMENDILIHLEKLLQENTVISRDIKAVGPNAFISSLVIFFEKNKELCSILLGEYGDPKFVSKVIEISREKSVREYQKLYPQATSMQVDIFFTFIANGFLGLLKYWLNNDHIPFSTLAANAEQIITEGTRFFTNN